MVYDGWRILYKLQIAVILVHSIIIFWYYSSIFQSGMILDKFLILRVANGANILSYIFGLLFYLLMDKPIRNIDRMVLFPTKISESFLIKRNQKSKGSGGGPKGRRDTVDLNQRKPDENKITESMTDLNEES